MQRTLAKLAVEKVGAEVHVLLAGSNLKPRLKAGRWKPTESHVFACVADGQRDCQALAGLELVPRRPQEAPGGTRKQQQKYYVLAPGGTRVAMSLGQRTYAFRVWAGGQCL